MALMLAGRAGKAAGLWMEWGISIANGMGKDGGGGLMLSTHALGCVRGRQAMALQYVLCSRTKTGRHEGARKRLISFIGAKRLSPFH